MTATTTEQTTTAAATEATEAPAAAAPKEVKPDTNSWGWGIARKNAKTGARIIIDRNGPPLTRTYQDVPVSLNAEGGKYLMFCIDHKTLAYTDSQNDAGEKRRAPMAWCPECAKIAAGDAPKLGLKPVVVKEPKPAKEPKAAKPAKATKTTEADVPVVTSLAEQQAEVAANGDASEALPIKNVGYGVPFERAERFEQPATAEVEGMASADGSNLGAPADDYTREPVDDGGEPVAEQPKPAKRRLGKSAK